MPGKSKRYKKASKLLSRIKDGDDTAVDPYMVLVREEFDSEEESQPIWEDLKEYLQAFIEGGLKVCQLTPPKTEDAKPISTVVNKFHKKYIDDKQALPSRGGNQEITRIILAFRHEFKNYWLDLPLSAMYKAICGPEKRPDTQIKRMVERRFWDDLGKRISPLDQDADAAQDARGDFYDKYFKEGKDVTYPAALFRKIYYRIYLYKKKRESRTESIDLQPQEVFVSPAAYDPQLEKEQRDRLKDHLRYCIQYYVNRSIEMGDLKKAFQYYGKWYSEDLIYFWECEEKMSLEVAAIKLEKEYGSTRNISTAYQSFVEKVLRPKLLFLCNETQRLPSLSQCLSIEYHVLQMVEAKQLEQRQDYFGRRYILELRRESEEDMVSLLAITNKVWEEDDENYTQIRDTYLQALI